MEAATSAGRASGLEPLELSADSVAAAALFQRHSAHVFRYCNARLRKREDAEDAVQTTFLHAFRSLRQGVKPLVESAWLLGIARNVCLSRWEASGRRNRLEAVCDPDVLARSAAAPQGRREELIGLENALARLPERQRRAVLLRDWRGLSYDEVAEQLGVSRAAVETLIFRGRQRLAELLREEPSTIRRRLGSLGNLGALVNAVKTAFTGGAAATKLAVAVTVVAASGAGIAAGPWPGGSAPVPTGPDVARPAATQSQAASAAAPPYARSEPARVAPAASATPPARKGGGIAPAARRSDRPSVAAAEAPATPAAPVAAAPVVSVPESSPRLTAPVVSVQIPKREQSPPAVPLVQTPPAPEVLPAVTTVVDEVVETVVPGLPAVSLPEVAELPVVGPVTEAAVQTAEQAVAPLLPTLPVQPPPVVPDLPLLPLLP
jgi:RNA polymerase sigma-70 factor, ECF subfamily